MTPRAARVPDTSRVGGEADVIRQETDMSRLLTSVLAVVEWEAGAVNPGQPGQHIGGDGLAAGFVAFDGAL